MPKAARTSPALMPARVSRIMKGFRKGKSRFQNAQREAPEEPQRANSPTPGRKGPATDWPRAGGRKDGARHEDIMEIDRILGKIRGNGKRSRITETAPEPGPERRSTRPEACAPPAKGQARRRPPHEDAGQGKSSRRRAGTGCWP